MHIPFVTSSFFNTLLSLEECEEIYFQAIQQVLAGKVSAAAVPDSFNLGHLRQQSTWFGYEACLAHPADIEGVFQSVSTSVFGAVEALYCNPIGRSMPMVYRILKRMAEEVGRIPITYEAIWSICVYLDRLHQKQTVVRQVVMADTWYIHLLPMNVKSSDLAGEIYVPYCLLVINECKAHINGFALTRLSNKYQSGLLALYDALCNQRQPAALETAGIIWQTPTTIKMPAEFLPVLTELCQTAGISPQDVGPNVPGDLQGLLNKIEADWNKVMPEEVINDKQLTRLFNTYLYKVCGYSPGRTQQERAHQWRHLVGFNRDPASVIPQLRNFLPEHPTVINQGIVLWNGLHYESPSLCSGRIHL